MSESTPKTGRPPVALEIAPSSVDSRGVMDLRSDPVALTAALVDILGESGHGTRVADEIEAALRAQTSGFEILRHGDAVLARTQLGRPTRVLLAGHTDTVHAAGNAVFLHLAATVAEPVHDITLIMYDGEESEDAANGLGSIESSLPDWLAADIAILSEPSGGFIEAGCQGALRATVSTTGRRAHSARPWLGSNAIHNLTNVLGRLRDQIPRSVDIEGCVCREGLSAVRLEGGISGNVIPDAATVTVNFRFAPDRSVEQAYAHVVDVFDGLDVTVEFIDAKAGALPGLTQPAVAELIKAAGGQAPVKFGWTDVSRFATLGIPAVNYGPADPNITHDVAEHVDIARTGAVTETLRRYLTG